MTKKHLILIAALFLSACASNDPWTKQDTWGQVAATIAIVGDGVSSINIRETDGISEHGAIARRIMGSQPTKQDLILYHGTLVVSSTLVTWLLPAKWRRYWQGFEVGIHGYAWHNNCGLGLC